ncbi:dTMP kinase [bacterium]|nr:dTMP kinase [bacterium]
MSSQTGCLITFEGPEGSGKSTLIKSIASVLLDIGAEIIEVREPGGTPVGEKIRDVLLDKELPELCAKTELLLMVASRAQLVQETLKPALADGKIILCDRYAESSEAYQGGGRELGTAKVREMNNFAIDDIIPDVTFLCMVPPEIGRQRTSSRELDRMELESIAFHDRVYKAYCDMADSDEKRFVVIDASKTPDEMLSSALEHFKKMEHQLLKLL